MITTHTYGGKQYFEVSHRQTCLDDCCRKRKNGKKEGTHDRGSERSDSKAMCGDNINTHLKQWSNP